VPGRQATTLGTLIARAMRPRTGAELLDWLAKYAQTTVSRLARRRSSARPGQRVAKAPASVQK